MLTSLGLTQTPKSAVAQLKADIARLEQIDRDPSVTEEVKLLNQTFLKQRRAQLLSLLTSEIAALRKYEADVGALLSPEEKQTVVNKIQELEQLFRDLGSPSDANTANVAGNTTSATSSTGSAVLVAGRTMPSLSGSPVATTKNSDRPSINPATQPSAAGTTPVQADCYPGAPLILNNAAGGAAAQFLTDGSRSVGNFLPRLIFFTIADAISSNEKSKAKSALIRTIVIRNFMEETARTDKQIGGPATSTGSTSLLEKPNFTNLLGFAIEHGAITEDVNGSSLNLSSSPYAIIAAAKGDTATTYKDYAFFNRIGISANFNIEDQNNVLASARRNQLTQWSIRGRLSGDRSTRSPEFETFWNAEVRRTFEQVPLILVNEFSDLFRDETETVRRKVADRFLGYTQQYVANNANLSDDAKRTGLQRELLCKLKQEVFDQVDSFGLTNDDRERILSKTLPALKTAIAAEADALELVKQKLKEMNEKPLATFAYTNKRVANGSDYSQFQFLFEQKTFSPMKIVGNAEVSIYNNPNRLLNQQRVRDMAFSLSLEGNAGRSPFVNQELDKSQITFSFSGRYERMLENRQVATRKADLAFAQFKLDVPFLSGMTLPFSVTYSNASELNKKDRLRANFGFNFDADKLFLIRTFLKTAFPATTH
jgi:hypothetical protein